MKQKRSMKIAMAPLEGITTYVFRNAYNKYYGGVDRYFTPFLTANHLKGRELRDVHPDNNPGIDLVPQILANDSEQFLEIARQLAELGYKEVNLNLGCPSGTVVSKKRGAGLLGDIKMLDEFLNGIYEGADKIGVQISIKTRIGMEFLSEWEDILSVYIKYPIKELIIHPRLRNEFYKGEVHMDAFRKALNIMDASSLSSADKRSSKCGRFHLTYNGDIVDVASYKAVLSEIGDSDIMIGRGLLMNPELANQIQSSDYEVNDSDFVDENPREKPGGKPGEKPDKKVFKEFIDELVVNYEDEMSGEKQVVQKMKELWVYFAKGLGVSDRRLKELLKLNRLAEYRSIVQMIMSEL